MRMTMDRLSDREYPERFAHLTDSALEDEEFCPLSQAEIERQGKHEIKQDGCVIVRVPSVDWERNGCAFPGRLPVLPIASSRSRGSTAGTGT